MGNSVKVKSKPKRIVSLVPSQTHLLHHLGLEEETVGITFFCIEPEEWKQTKTSVGGTKKLKIKVIKDLKPDLIIGCKEENTKEDIKKLQEFAPVWMSDVNDVETAIDMIETIGEITDTFEKAKKIADKVKFEFEVFKTYTAKLGSNGKKVLYFIWKKPYMVTGQGTFIDSMLESCGLINACTQERYPEIKDPSKYDPDYVFLPDEPYVFEEEHKAEFQKLYPRAKVVLVDGQYFSWFGPKLLKATWHFMSILDELADDPPQLSGGMNEFYDKPLWQTQNTQPLDDPSKPKETTEIPTVKVDAKTQQMAELEKILEDTEQEDEN